MQPLGDQSMGLRGDEPVGGDFVPISRDQWPAAMRLPAVGQRLPSKRLREDFEVIR